MNCFLLSVTAEIAKVEADYPPHHDDVFGLSPEQYKQVVGNLAGYRVNAQSLLSMVEGLRFVDVAETKAAERNALCYYVKLAKVAA